MLIGTGHTKLLEIFCEVIFKISPYFTCDFLVSFQAAGIATPPGGRRGGMVPPRLLRVLASTSLHVRRLANDGGGRQELPLERKLGFHNAQTLILMLLVANSTDTKKHVKKLKND